MKRIILLVLMATTIAPTVHSVSPGAYFAPLPDGLNVIEAHPQIWSGPFFVVCYNEEGKECSRPFAIKVEGGEADIRIEQKREFFLRPLSYGTMTLFVSLIHEDEDVSRAYGYPTLAKSYITFANLVEGKMNIIKIYNSTGQLVKVIETARAEAEWDLRNEARNSLAWGVYIYVITCEGSDIKKTGKIAIIR